MPEPDPAPAACGTGPYGAHGDVAGAVYVLADTQCSSAGTADQPHRTLAGALAQLAGAGQGGTVVLGEGTYTVPDEFTTAGWRLLGRCPDLVRLRSDQPAVLSVPSGGGLHAQDLQVLGPVDRADGDGLVLNGGDLSLQSVVLADSPGTGLRLAVGTARLTDVQIVGAGDVGLMITAGSHEIEGLRVQGGSGGGRLGRGVDISGQSTQVQAKDWGIEDVGYLGLAVWKGARLAGDDVRVEGVVPQAGGGGVGVLISDGGTAELSGLALRDHSWGGLAVHDIGSALVVAGLEISGTGEDRGDETEPFALQVSEGQLDGTDVVLAHNEGLGMHVVGGAEVALQDLSISDTFAGEDGRYGRAIDVTNATLTMTRAALLDNDELGMHLYLGAVTLEHVRIEGTRRPPSMTQAAGVLAQQGSRLSASDLVVVGTEGPALVSLSESDVACLDCELAQSRFAGAVAQGGFLTLEGGRVWGTVPAEMEGAGFGVYVDAANRPAGHTRLSLVGTQVDGHTLAAVYLAGDVAADVQGAILEGGAIAQTGAGRWTHGDALFLAPGTQVWDPDATWPRGVRVQDSQLAQAEGAGVFAHGASASFSGNTWANNQVDVHIQGCSPTPPVLEGLEEQPALETERCPEFDAVWTVPAFSLVPEEVSVAL